MWGNFCGSAPKFTVVCVNFTYLTSWCRNKSTGDWKIKKLNKQLSWKILFILDNVYKGFRLSRLGLLTETLTGTLLDLKRLFTQDLTLSTGTVELRFLKPGCLRSDKIAANRYHNRPLREQFPPLIMPTMPWIETHQPWARFVIHQSLTIMVV